MDFKYYEYDQDLFKEIIGQEAEIYLFKNYQDLKEAVRVYQPELLQKQSLFLTVKEFKDRLFSSDQIVIKEEKLPLILFSVLTAKEKSELRLDSYQDIYQFSQRFFDYFKLKQNYRLSSFNELADWQQERVQRLNKIKARYQNKLAELGYLDQLLLKEEKNLNTEFLTDYQNINFFNILDFTPYFKDLLQELSQNFKVKLHLQLKRGDFDEDSLELKKITLPEIDKNKFEIRKNNSILKSLAAILNELSVNEAETEIIDPADEIETAHILSQKLNLGRYKSLQETEAYIFLESLYQLYQQGKKASNILIDLKELYSLTGQKLFRNWLELDANSLLQIKDLIEDDYYYLDQDLIEQQLPSLSQLLLFLQQIRKIKDTAGLIELLSNLFDFLLKDQPQKIVERFNDSLLELQSVEEMGIVTSWQDYYSDRGGGLFALFLNHLKFKSLALAADEDAVQFLSLDNTAQKQHQKLLFNNCIQKEFALKKDGLLFLSEKQLQVNGLQLKHKKLLLKKYNFLRHLFSADKAVIFTVENEEHNISPAVILEELILKYGLKFKESRLKDLSEKEILNNLFDFNKKPELKVNNSAAFNKEMQLANDDFGSSFNFSYYKYKNLKDCYHRFYLEDLIRLNTELKITPYLSLLSLGILTHQIFGELIVYARKEKILPSQVPAAVREKIITRAIKANELKIDQDYLNYYYQIIYKSLDCSFMRFAGLLQKYLPQDYSNILVEWPQWNKELQKYFKAGRIDFYLSGRIDLLLLSENQYFIIDFKTGSGDFKQLDFYSLMLRQNYEEQLPAESRKAIYNVFGEDFEHSYHKIGKEDQLGAELKELSLQLFAAGEYERIYKSRCQRCPYREICRVEVKDNEKSY
ncbi:PD-(D/E)XK nuclease superfamily protein [Halanaerobium saccharolyticum]|uniref:PD-(D/E)XK nuclease superfamily protein n=1 Tax=Halanaerobium saccharolyticum TaxID=43595 RepID=A0A4R7Z654_9FIRM|nr:PD-(D/E)XK nuclease family protein [Halanaerobium saccharolyticum]RAK10523.1 PD-(D/E)XK nuclease superfamily protein [Halanaerobium saccharolyticum]TDW06720.1 PD-(D/E)XK nuclease superfamily protein [Halanaerobium saccharolyticum]TDX62355.1 PD-(D/E)XK nuclease superfamily protein [Halanaerobium saccharolyticum]